MKKHLRKILAKALILWILLLALGSVMAQGWIKTYEDVGCDYGVEYWSVYPEIIATTDDNYLLISATANGHILRKIDSDGDLLWEKALDIGHDVAALSGGYCVITGRTSTDSITLTKLAPDGTDLWTKNYAPMPNGVQWGKKALGTLDNGVVIAASVYSGGFGYAILLKTDESGNLLWVKEYNAPNGDGKNYINDIILTLDGGFAFTGLRDGSGGISFLTKTDSEGNIEWDIDIDIGVFSGLIQLPNSGFFMTGDPGGGSIIAMKLDEGGSTIWTKNIAAPIEPIFVNNTTLSIDGLPCIVGTSFFPNIGDKQILLIKFGNDGNEIWTRHYGFLGIDEEGASLLSLPDGSFLLAGVSKVAGQCDGAIVIKTDSLGIYSSALAGIVHYDPEFDCHADTAEAGFASWLVQADGAQYFATLTDSFGYFTLPVDTGSYTVTVSPSGPYWDICNNPTTVNVTTFYDTTQLDFPVQVEYECPYLEVSLTAPFLRRCFDNTYTVQYCNYGTVTAEDAYIEVTLDTFLTYQSSTIPIVSQNGNTLTFDLGDVEVSQCGSFGITAYLDCDNTVLGQTHCTEAHVFPDSLCLPTSPLWDGSNIKVDVDCVGDSVIFNIQNTGSGDMLQPLNYIIIEDQIVLFEGTFQLDVGETMSIAVFANGTTFHIEAEQSFYHPSGNSSTGATVEGCGGWFSLGFFTQFSNPDDSPFIDIDCQENVGSFDPNDKQASPVGFGEEHLIEPQTELEYLIRFQNTGTDTAFNVVVVDLLPATLDLATLWPGASSHPYEYGVSPEGWPMFTFKDIMLPDSNVNEAASHGFVKFKISQREVNGNGTFIKNSALIYFDFNSPIQTNTVVHKVGQVFPWTVVDVNEVIQLNPTLRIAPNPVTDRAILYFENMEAGMLRLLLVDPKGQVLRDERQFGTGFNFQKGSLAPGIYFFKIEKDGEWVSSGKVIIQ